MLKKVSLFFCRNLLFVLCFFPIMSLTSSGKTSYYDMLAISLIFLIIFNGILFFSYLIKKRKKINRKASPKSALLFIMTAVFFISVSVIFFSSPSSLGSLSSSRLIPVYEEELEENLFLEVYKVKSDNRYYCNLVHKGPFFFYASEMYLWDEDDINYSSGNLGIKIDSLSFKERSARLLYCRPLKDKRHTAFCNDEKMTLIDSDRFDLTYIIVPYQNSSPLDGYDMEVFDENNVRMYPSSDK